MSTINAEWLNQNSQRTYPFRENMQLRPLIDGSLAADYRIPNELILDMAMVSTSYDSPPSVYLSKVTFVGGVVTVVFSDAGSDEAIAVASTVLSGEDITPVNFFGVGKHDDIRGTVVFGDLAKVGEELPDGIYTYPSTETMFETRCVRPSVPCVSGLFLSNSIGTVESSRLRGDVALIAGKNVKLEYDEENNAIVINARSDYDYNDKCDCDFQDNRDVVKTVNGISVQNVVIEGDGECVEVETSDGRIRISDTCSKPCCGCAELTFLNEKTNEISTSQSRLSAFAEALNQRVQEFTTNILLSDKGSANYV